LLLAASSILKGMIFFLFFLEAAEVEKVKAAADRKFFNFMHVMAHQ
jgi:hypothetical protein